MSHPMPNRPIVEKIKIAFWETKGDCNGIYKDIVIMIDLYNDGCYEGDTAVKSNAKKVKNFVHFLRGRLDDVERFANLILEGEQHV